MGLILALGLGCYRPAERGLMQRSVEARQVYGEADFDIERLRDGGVTVLSARLRLGQETYGRAVVTGLVEALELQLEGEGVVHPNLAAGRINDADLADAYAEMLDAYDETSILDRDELGQIAQAVRVRYLAIPTLVDFREETSTRFSVLGIRIGKTAMANARLQVQIWDGGEGHVVWEGISDLTLGQEVVRERPVRLEDTIGATCRSVLEQIPGAVLSRDLQIELEEPAGGP